MKRSLIAQARGLRFIHTQSKHPCRVFHRCSSASVLEPNNIEPSNDAEKAAFTVKKKRHVHGLLSTIEAKVSRVDDICTAVAALQGSVEKLEEKLEDTSQMSRKIMLLTKELGDGDSQGLCLMIASKEKEALANKVSVDNQQMDLEGLSQMSKEFVLLTKEVQDLRFRIDKNLEGFSQMSEEFPLLIKEVQELRAKPDASCGDMEKYSSAATEDLLQGLKEELQGLRVLLALKEEEESAHRVSVDNQQTDSFKRIWEEMACLQRSMASFVLEFSDDMKAIKTKLDENHMQLASRAQESTRGKDRSNVVLVTLSSAFLACSTALCAWTLQIW